MIQKLLEKTAYTLSLFKKAFGAYSLQISVLAGIGFLSGMLEGLGANTLIPLFSFIVGGSAQKDPISRAIEWTFNLVGTSFTLKHILIFITLLFISKSILLLIASYIQFKITYDYEKKTRGELFHKALKSQWRFLLEQKIGYLEKVLSVEIGYMSRLLRTSSSLILTLTGLVIYIAVAINISPLITLVALGTGLLALVVFHPLVTKTRTISREFSIETRSVAHFVNENVIGMKTVKTMSVAGAVDRVSNVYFETLRRLQLRRSLLGTLFGTLFQSFAVIFILLIFSFSYKAAGFSLPSFIAIAYLIQRIFSYVQNVQTDMQVIWSSLPYLEHVLQTQDQTLQNEEENVGGSPFMFKNSFSFNNVRFTYARGREILRGTTFYLPKGSFTGLIGPSGAGKTTIVDLALRLFEPTSGQILLDTTPISSIDIEELRRNIGYVSQDIHLINDTVANNIRFFDSAITDEEVVEAARKANIYDVIEALPDSFSSIVGERGVRFSAGQRQRIVIARVLARKPKLLILDEATSALDNESEKRVQEVIENLKGKITVLVIAHRLGTVMNCDSLIVLDKGEIVEKGSPTELLANKQSYFYKVHTIRE